MKTSVANAVIAVLLGASLVACSNDDKSPVCTSADDLKTAVADLNNIDFTAPNGAAKDLKDNLRTVQSDWEKLKSDAKSKFSSQIDAVDNAFASLKTSIQTAVADPTAANLAAIRAAAPSFESSVQELVRDVKSTC
ncbi:MAG TPA: hypothetical protein VFX15_03915 [Actinomycetes bacterium]|nr:hypothetical protein [Actinomycetes bacterium]